jgi:hypothetical protein
MESYLSLYCTSVGPPMLSQAVKLFVCSERFLKILVNGIRPMPLEAERLAIVTWVATHGDLQVGARPTAACPGPLPI